MRWFPGLGVPGIQPPPIPGAPTVGLPGPPLPVPPPPTTPMPTMGLPPIPQARRGVSPTQLVEEQANAALGLQEQGMQEQARAEAEKAAFLGEGKAKIAREGQAYAADLEQRRTERHQDEVARSAELDAEAQAIADTDVDRSAVFGDSATAGGIINRLAALGGLIASSIVQTKRGGRNIAVEMISKMIDDSVRDQTEKLARRSEAVKGKQSLLAQMMARGDRLEDAQMRTKEMGFKAAADELDAVAAQYEQGVQSGKIKEAAGQLRGKAAEFANERRHQAETERNARAQLGLAAKGQKLQETQMWLNEANRMKQEIAQARAKGDEAEVKRLQEEGEKTVWNLRDPKDPSKAFVATDVKSRNVANQLLGEADNAANDLRQLIDLNQKIGARPRNPVEFGLAMSNNPDLMRDMHAFDALKDKLATTQIGGGKVMQPDGTTVNIPQLGKIDLGTILPSSPVELNTKLQLAYEALQGDVAGELSNVIGYNAPVLLKPERDALLRQSAPPQSSGPAAVGLPGFGAPQSPPGADPALLPFLQQMMRGGR